MANTRVAVGVAVGICAVLAFAALMFVTGFGLGFPEAGLFVGIFGLVVLNFILVIAAIVHALVRDDLSGVQRLIWVAIVFFVTPVVALGAIVYFALGKERTRTMFRDVTTSAPASTPPRDPSP